VPTVTSSTTIGGTATLVFPQVGTGGTWSTDIVLGNTSSGIQSVRIDFFNPDGLVTVSLTDITIRPRGVFFFSSEGSPTTGNYVIRVLHTVVVLALLLATQAPEKQVISVYVDLVNIYFTVCNNRGRLITNLDQANFAVH